MSEPKNQVDQAVAEGGAYEVLHNRLLEHGRTLEQQASQLNTARQDEFGSTDMAVLGRVRLRTEHNCSARDLVRIGNYVLLGFNVTMGLKKSTHVNDVFALYQPTEIDGQYDVEEIPIKGSFLADGQFTTDFNELYSYYKNTRLTQLVVKNNKLLAAFQIGDRLSDQRVFRWSLNAQGEVLEYIDNRGERDIELPSQYDFEWVSCTRDDIVEGRHPHFNILDTLFVDCQRGDLTLKVENNTNTGLGLYSEPVVEPNQSLDDCEVSYADIGQLILLRILPYNEEQHRYLVFNKELLNVARIDMIGQSCVQLPEDHGIMFPGGYYLNTGEQKSFDGDTTGMTFKRTFRSPNGEDVMYVFYEPNEGKVGLFAYNLIEKQLQNPLYGHGYGFFEDGRLALFYAETEATRVHPMQIWNTPYQSDEFASQQPQRATFYGRIGNAELVRGISELYSIVRAIRLENVNTSHYNRLTKDCHRLFDAYFWLEAQELPKLAKNIRDISQTAELVLDEFEKVTSIREQSEKALEAAAISLSDLVRQLQPDSWHKPQEFVNGLAQIRQQRGHLLTLKEYRYIDLEHIATLDQSLAEHEDSLNLKTLEFLAKDDAFTHYIKQLEDTSKEAKTKKTVAELMPLINSLDELSDGLDLLSELVSTLKVPDPTLQTKIVESISTVYGQLNQHKARLQQQKGNMGSSEAIAQFGARFKLLSQSVHNAIGMATSPEKCDEQLARLLVQLEELESQFSEHDEFLSDILTKREEIYETFENHKQTLLDARQRRAQNLFGAAERIMSSVTRRCQTFKDTDQLNTFFASDALVQKIRGLAEDLRNLEDVVRADDIEARLKAQKDQAIRTLRDQVDLFEGGGNIIKLGPRHKFSVNTQPLDLTLLVRDGEQNLHLTGTDYYQTLVDQQLIDLEPYWEQSLPSENDDVYRAEYLAYQILRAGQLSEEKLSLQILSSAATDNQAMLDIVREFSTQLYKEGYEKGIHDQDAATLLSAIVPKFISADVFRFSPDTRALGIAFWANNNQIEDCKRWVRRAVTAKQQRDLLNSYSAWHKFQSHISGVLKEFVARFKLDANDIQCQRSADYLIEELSRSRVEFATSKYAQQLKDDFKTELDSKSIWSDFETVLSHYKGEVGERWHHTQSWLEAFVNENESRELLRGFIPEAITLINAEQRIDRRSLEADLVIITTDLFGQHKTVDNGSMTIVLDEFLHRLQKHHDETVPCWNQLQQARSRIVDHYRDELRLDQYKAKPLASFVRNKLISEVYLSLIGDNLAKQMGTVGDSKRTDLMGLLLMISPPGYGKTTLMEYTANRLGLVFMKINCPAIGHDVTSIDPAAANNSAARQELEKLNLGLEMGNNVMLYLDDIQHTNPEFLQKFISLCDGTRRIEGIWQGKSKTYDMRGKKFCVVMAGNPYTESGELFQIPDMLANRADIYNLGDELSGKEEVFALSYLENSMTSNPILAPLATRNIDDFYKLVDMTQQGHLQANELSHQYSGAELQEISSVLKRMFAIQKVVLDVNREYIASAATAEKYRTEPSFKLQGSYRNMNKMAEKISSVMTDNELTQLIADHYQGEAQLLTQGTEENLLKLALLREAMTDAEEIRWKEILESFQRSKSLGGDGADTGTQMVSQLIDLVQSVDNLGSSTPVNESNEPDDSTKINSQLVRTLAAIEKNLSQLTAVEPNVQVINQPVPGIDLLLKTLADTFEHSLVPLAKIMDGKINIDLKNLEKMSQIQKDIKALSVKMKETEVSTNESDHS